MAAQALPLALFAVLVPFAVYRRVRSNIGRQPLQARRLKLRTGVMALLLALLTGPALLHGRSDALVAVAAGGAIGALIAVLALRHTRFEQADGAEFYVPHPYLGLALSSLLLARMAYRLHEIYPLMMQPGGAPPMPLAQMSPLTLGLIGLILLYNSAFSIGLLRHLANRPR